MLCMSRYYYSFIIFKFFGWVEEYKSYSYRIVTVFDFRKQLGTFGSEAIYTKWGKIGLSKTFLLFKLFF